MNQGITSAADPDSRFVRTKAAAVRRAVPAFLAAALFLTLNGCVVGLIYTKVVEPLDLNADATPMVLNSRAGDIKQVQYSIIDVRWDSNAIGDIAKREGIETVYFADIETLSIVLGIWRRRTVYIYGR
jgi:hypothetical protein